MHSSPRFNYDNSLRIVLFAYNFLSMPVTSSLNKVYGLSTSRLANFLDLSRFTIINLSKVPSILLINIFGLHICKFFSLISVIIVNFSNITKMVGY